MLVRFGRRLAMLALLSGAAFLATPSSARAAVTLTLSQTGFADAVATGANSAFFFGEFGDFAVNLDTGSSAASTATQAFLVTTTSSTRNSSSGVRTLTVTVEQTFTTPISEIMSLDSNLSTTQISGPNTVTFQSFLNSTGTTVVTATGPLSPPAPGTGGSSPTILVSGVSGSYTLRNVTTITLGAGGSANSTGTSLAMATPEPGTMVMASSALGLFGLVKLRRRKNA